MCGILAVLNKTATAVERDRLRHQCDLIEHRGPDGSGIWTEGRVGFGHRRLSILDLSEQGAQPMASRDNDFVITYNGEVYNYRELRAELESLGESFRSGTDTEVVLAAYRRWGEECVHRFNGMWAFAIYDAKKQIVFCSRDRFGIKPLYFYQDDTMVCLSSEIRQILPLLEKRRVNRTVLGDYLLTGFLEHRHDTFFEGIEKVEGGHNLIFDLRSGRAEVKRWYRIERNDEPVTESFADSCEKVRSLLESSVRFRLRSDVKAGTCLSGGIDSSAIATLAANIYRKETGEAFSAIHAKGGDAESDESHFAKELSANKGLELHVIEPGYDDFLRSIDKVIESQEEPFGSTSVFMQYFVMQKAREIGCPVMLDGQGGDEVFLGYEKYFPAAFYGLLKRNPFKAASGVLAAMKNNRGMSLKGTARYTLGAFLSGARYSAYKRQVPFLKTDWIEQTSLLPRIGRSYRDPFEIQRLEIERSNLPVLLRYEDKNSMAHSIEARVPFLDYRLVEMAVNLPFDHKIRDGWAKHVLRKAVSDIIPEENLWRREKFGFNSPHGEWMDRNRERALEEMANSAILREICDWDSLKRDFAKTCTRAQWRFYNLAVWERIFKVESGQ